MMHNHLFSCSFSGVSLRCLADSHVLVQAFLAASQ
jgi:hypothetical protein